jgi:hypothetical protein
VFAKASPSSTLMSPNYATFGRKFLFTNVRFPKIPVV